MMFPSMSYSMNNEVSTHNKDTQTFLKEVYKNLNDYRHLC